MANWSTLNAKSTSEIWKRKRVEGATHERPYGAAGEQKGDSGNKEQNENAQDENDKSSAENQDGGQEDDRLDRPDVDTGDDYRLPLKQGSGYDFVSGKEILPLGILLLQTTHLRDATRHQTSDYVPRDLLETSSKMKKTLRDREDFRIVKDSLRRILEESSERRKTTNLELVYRTLEPNQPSIGAENTEFVHCFEGEGPPDTAQRPSGSGSECQTSPDRTSNQISVIEEVLLDPACTFTENTTHKAAATSCHSKQVQAPTELPTSESAPHEAQRQSESPNRRREDSLANPAAQR
ncbi:hypothetical protein ABVK25_002368 [Lepraria finkii]|uniref:Uncharacterized protein n=1 Tax=Lepraria finkii TaxID=1340010 RepID=A0ABR4BI42_9LECA